ncbi:MAG: hypothetical protein KGM97_10840 [Alphaproteobacteria bacterium]|nr:hypothetical protein [Alphaproteobacteria bacterium]MDE2631473.1 hypothetical protein [Alphaproteobacteria bacterium]
MAVDMLEHFTVRCSRLERTRDFYPEIIGLRVGLRPDFDFASYWLYLGDQPVVHLVRESQRARSHRLPRPGFGRHALLRL